MHNSNIDVNHIFDLGTPIDDAVAAGVREALRRHKLLGQSIAIWRDGKAVVIPPEEIQLDDEPTAPSSS
jgi:hypothetical protein